MQVSATNIILIVSLITTMTLIVVGFLLAYVAIYNKRKKKHIEEKDKMQLAFSAQLLQSQLEIQEQTFQNISEEIHDHVGQLLSLASIQLQMVLHNQEQSEVTLNEIKENVDTSLADLRSLAKNLNGGYLQQLSLTAFLQHMQKQLGRNNYMQCQVEIQAEEQALPVQHKIILFRILQECFQNVMKHAQATLIEIRVTYDEVKALTINFKDNGKGFITAPDTIKGLGLQNMQHRIALLQGTLHIESEPSKGTLIHLNIPHHEC
ncbi:hypothetical protein DBR32_13695 [Taibaiella sp. KBW10]|uniref:sensor histidine kinase n=1 Tax=Taibaiella sp. KBW10 TaxID=2153357 RepID=UPI000F5AF3F3|nr:ATP-binding protein [Taibaiella sp. KBW10]RQO29963.1 hypothetical protein DBR32_13695 [Taibaiella sp. KBW10]